MRRDTSATRVTQAIRARLATLPDGARLPATRGLVAELRVSPLTVRAAIARLTAEGAVEARPGIGTFAIRRDPARAGDLAWQSVALGPARADSRADEDLLALPPLDALPLSSG